MLTTKISDVFVGNFYISIYESFIVCILKMWKKCYKTVRNSDCVNAFFIKSCFLLPNWRKTSDKQKCKKNILLRIERKQWINWKTWGEIVVKRRNCYKYLLMVFIVHCVCRLMEKYRKETFYFFNRQTECSSSSSQRSKIECDFSPLCH